MIDKLWKIKQKMIYTIFLTHISWYLAIVYNNCAFLFSKCKIQKHKNVNQKCVYDEKCHKCNIF